MPVRPREEIGLMEGYHSPQLDVAVRLNTNEAPEAPPRAFVEQLSLALDDIAYNRYPDRSANQLREALGSLHGVAGSKVFVANGSNEVLQTLLMTYGGPGRSAAVWEPTYALHSHIARLTATEVVVGERSEDFELTPAEIERVFSQHQPSVAFLCSPNNPTGLAEERETVETVLRSAQRGGCLVVVDEAYGQFAPWSAEELLGDDVPLVVTRTFSKTWSMAAVRLGYMLGPSWVVDELMKVVLPYHLDSIKQRAGVIALDHVGEMTARVDRLIAERERVVAGLATLPVKVWPSQSNFVLFKPLTLPGADVWRGLVERSVLVRDCSSWPRLEGCLRVTIGTPDEDDLFLSALSEILI